MFPQFLLFMGACIASTFAQAEVDYLNKEILPICFESPVLKTDGSLYINGQTEPLANSLENFLSLVEKLELANPDIELQDVLLILLKNYTAENVYYQSIENFLPFGGALQMWKPNSGTVISLEDLLKLDKAEELPRHFDPFEKNERCSLFFMLSHTVNDTSRPKIDQKSYSLSVEGTQFSKVLKTHFPREQGVVSIGNDTAHAVALGRVLLGLYVGLKAENERRRPVDSYEKLKGKDIGDINNVDILYLVTLADQLIISKYPFLEKSKADLGENGKWKSGNLLAQANGEEFPICPTIYELPENATSAYTFSSVRGGVDGLILGDVIGTIHSSKSNIRLTQILRMYYGRNGLQEQTNAPSHEVIHFCKRLDKIAPKENVLKDQMRVFLAFFSDTSLGANFHIQAFNTYEQKKSDILLSSGLEKECNALELESKDDLDDLKCEAAIDVIFVMDTSRKINEENQMKIIGHLANRLELVYGGSTLTVFTDKRNGSSGLSLVPVVNKTSSSSCAACASLNRVLDSVDTENGQDYQDKEIVIYSINKVLKNMEEEEKTLNGAKGKVVIFFHFEEEETVSYRLQSALRSLYLQHVGVQFFAIGNNKDVLKIYAQGQIQNVITVNDRLPPSVADILAKKICEVPSKLQYEDCESGRNEAGAIYEGLISPNSIQRWAMHPKYFHKSFTPKMFFQFDRTDWPIKICQSRAYSRAEDREQNCRHISSTERHVEFNTTNPCKGFNEHNCATWYFTISVGRSISDQTQQYCEDTNTLRCKTLDQMKFKVSHEGIRCNSGCGLFSIKDLLFACFAAYSVMKFWNVNMQ